jgi:hypothetical protein
MGEYYAIERSGTSLTHHGILGMKWGVRRYQNKDGSLTAAGRARYKTYSNPYERKAERRQEKSREVAKAHLDALRSGNEKAVKKTEKKALKALNKYLNAEETAAAYDSFEAHNSKKKYAKTESKIKRLTQKNTDGRYTQKLQELTEKSNTYKKDLESKQLKANYRRSLTEKIVNSARASGYSVREISRLRTFQTGKQKMALLLGVYAYTNVSSIEYKVKR